MKIVITIVGGELRVTWPNEERHVYRTHDDQPEHEITDALANVLADLTARDVIDPQEAFKIGAGDFAVGAGELQLEHKYKKPLRVAHQLLPNPPLHIWKIYYDDGSIHDIYDADYARLVQEAILND